MAADQADKTPESDTTPGNQPSSPTFGPEQLKQAEKSGGLSTPTAPGKINYTGSGSKTKSSGDGSSSTTPGDVNYDSSGKALEQAEKSLYNPGPQDNAGELAKMKPSIKGVLGFSRTNRGKIIIGGAATGAVTLAIVGFLALIPFKILHIVNNLQDRFYASSENAVSHETDILFSQYLKSYVLPGLNSCKAGTTIDKSCTPKAIQGNSIVSKLYKGWKGARLENTLADKYGLEFQKVGSHFYMKAPALTAGKLDLRDFENSKLSLGDFIEQSGDPQFTKVSRTQLRAYVEDSLSKGTSWKTTMYRFKVGRLLEEKYGIKRCIVACESQDNFADWKDSKKLASKAYLIDRVITPRSQALGLVLKCLLAGTSDGAASSVCPSITPQQPDTACETGSCELGGEPDTAWEKNLRAEFDAYRATLGNKAADDLLKEVQLIRDNGYSAYLYEKLFGGSGEDISKSITQDPKDTATAAQFSEQLTELSKSANIVGAINKVANILHFLGSAGPQLQKMTYITNAATMVDMFSMYRTYADEIKSGNVDATIVGSFTDSLNSGVQDPLDTSTELGGTAGAENTPFYGSVFGDQAQQTASTSGVLGLLSGNAYAVTTSDNSGYICNNGKPVPAGKLVCDEENLNYNPLASDLSGAFATEPLSTIKTIVDKYENLKNGLFGPIIKLVSWTLGQLSSFITQIANLLPGVGTLEQEAAKLFGMFSDWLINQAIPSPASSNMSAGRTVDLIGGGADASGNDFAHHGLGGQMLTTKQVTEILDQQNQLAQANRQSESMFARVFSTDDSNSVSSRLAMSLPSSLSDVKSSVASLFMSPFRNFSSLFSPAHAETAQGDPFGITQYGYPTDDPIFQTDPEAYWNNNCVDPGQEDNAQVSLAQNKETYQWNAAATLNATNYMPENTTTNPCLLIQAAVGSAGAVYDSSLLTADDQSGGSTTSAASGSNGNNGSSATGPVDEGTNAQLAQKILDYQKTGQYTCLPTGQTRTDCNDLQDTIAGKSLAGNDGCQAQALDPRVLKIVLYVIEVGGFKVGTSAMCGDHHDDGPTGHAGGFAVDFAEINGVAVNSSSAKPTTLKFVQFVNSIFGQLAPRQLISGGYGDQSSDCTGGVYDSDLQALEIPNSATFGGDGGDNACHRNHVHVGY